MNDEEEAASIVDNALEDKPELLVHKGDLPATVAAARDLLAQKGEYLFERGAPVVIKKKANQPPVAVDLTVNSMAMEIHKLCRPVEPRATKSGIVMVPVTWPERAAKMYLDPSHDWKLRPLAGVTSSPLLGEDGSARTLDGYDPETKLFCCNVPSITLPEQPSFEEAWAAFQNLRKTFRTFPFTDAVRRIARREDGSEIEVVDLEQDPGEDESAFLTGLMTAVARPSLPFAPGLLITSPMFSGAGTGKGKLIRAASIIAFGDNPAKPFTRGHGSDELDKRLVAELIEASPILFLDNLNNTHLVSHTLASVLTESHCRARPLGKSEMRLLNTTAWVAVTGNGLSLAEDLLRRFIHCEIDAKVEDPEQRKFQSGFLETIQKRRYWLLKYLLTIFRFGRQQLGKTDAGARLGSYETWGRWCRDPWLIFGCKDPIARISRDKKRDEHRQSINSFFMAWREHHGNAHVRTADVNHAVWMQIDPTQKMSRQKQAARLQRLAGTRVNGMVLERKESDAKWGADTYAVLETGEEAGQGRSMGGP